MKILEALAPDFLVKKAFHKLSNPEVHKLRPHEEGVIRSARRATKKFKQFDIATYTWGHGPKKALLVHGWEGQAANFAAIVPLLVDRGFTVESFDAPSHGFSTKAPTNIFDYKDLVLEFLKANNYPFIMSHSFGSVPLTYALWERGDYPLHQLVMVTSPDTLKARVEQIAAQLKLSDKMVTRILNKFQEETGKDPNVLAVSEFVKSLKPNEAKIFHGSNDRVLPLEWSERIQQNLANCELEVLDGLGHYKILYDEKLLTRIDGMLNY
ncbi:MAG: alpha/beta hydrolase [Flavobacteriales bacterium]|nr:alpha/beta hydrolase [Flavobacteriales bacterium]